MSFLTFFLYLSLTIIIYLIIGIIIYKIFFKKKKENDTLTLSDLLNTINSGVATKIENEIDKDFWSDKKNDKNDFLKEIK